MTRPWVLGIILLGANCYVAVFLVLGSESLLWTFPTLVLSAAVLLIARKMERFRRKSREAITKRIGAAAQRLRDLIPNTFLVQPCGTCAESSMRVLSMSPGGRSVQYECKHCYGKARALAGTPEARETLESWEELEALKRVAIVRWSLPVAVTVEFETVAAPMPWEQTSREPIPSAVRAEVWRRDQGRCVQCGVRESLQFDHIIPVARGGTTSVQNLQLLCRQCNLKKSAAI